MTTPQAIVTGFSLVALAIASLPYNTSVIPKAQAMPFIEMTMMLENQREILNFIAIHNKNVMENFGRLDGNTKKYCE